MSNTKVRNNPSKWTGWGLWTAHENGLSLGGLGLPLSTADRGSIPDEKLRATFRERFRPPAIDLGLPFDDPADIENLISHWICFDIIRSQSGGTNLEGPGNCVDWEMLPLFVPVLPLMGVSCAHYEHCEELHNFLLETDFRGVSSKISLQSRDFSPTCYEEEPAPGPFDVEALVQFVGGFPGTAGLVLKQLSGALGDSLQAADPRQASAAATELFGIPLDVRRGTLLRPDEVENAVRLAYTDSRGPKEVEKFVASRIPRIRAAHVGQWDGCAFAGAIWSCDLDVALNGEECLNEWLSRQSVQ